jgi:hypothetical protein
MLLGALTFCLCVYPNGKLFSMPPQVSRESDGGYEEVAGAALSGKACSRVVRWRVGVVRFGELVADHGWSASESGPMDNNGKLQTT